MLRRRHSRVVHILKTLKAVRAYHGAGILFWDKDSQGKTSVLLGLRTYNPQKGQWSIPAGGWEETDGYDRTGSRDYRQTAIRETWEEIRVKVETPEELTFLWGRHLPFFHFVVYACRLSGRRNVIRYQEFSEVRWFPVEAIPANSVGFVKSQVAALVRQHHTGKRKHKKNLIS